MKIILNITLATMILAGIVAVNTPAQTGAQKVVANIPFEFTVGKATLPSGRYTVAMINPTSDRKISAGRSWGTPGRPNRAADFHK